MFTSDIKLLETTFKKLIIAIFIALLVAHLLTPNCSNIPVTVSSRE